MFTLSNISQKATVVIKLAVLVIPGKANILGNFLPSVQALVDRVISYLRWRGSKNPIKLVKCAQVGLDTTVIQKSASLRRILYHLYKGDNFRYLEVSAHTSLVGLHRVCFCEVP